MRASPIIRALIAVMAVAACSGDSTTAPVVTPPPAATVASVTVAAGNSQTATVGQAATTPLSVTVMGSDAKPFPGATVTWQVTSGGGSVSPATSQTNAQGVATTQWTMGSAPGNAAVRASVTGVTSPADFSAIAIVGAVAAVAVSPASPTIDALGATVQLVAEARDALGNVIPNASFTWSSGAAAIATVSATGLATGVTVGTASVTASAGGITGSTPLIVRQVLASMTVGPIAPSISQGTTVQLAAQGKDARGNAIATAPSVAWSSATQGVATVSATGVVTGVAAGSSSITATSGTITANTAVTVVGNFAPSANTALSGTMTVGSLTIPNGVTVTATGDLNITALGAVQISGTLAGDCKAITINGRGSATYTGVIRNTCAVAPAGAPPAMTLNNNGPLTVTGATITRAGVISMSNSAGAGGAPAGGPGSSLMAAGPCTFTGGADRPAAPAQPGTFSAPTGTAGGDGGWVTVACDGDLTIGGGRVIESGSGGTGGGANGTGNGTGGPGGTGGDMNITATGNIIFSGATLIVGNGGNGGSITANNLSSSASATGGPGGDGGVVQIRAVQSVTVQASGLSVTIGQGGNGGNGSASAGDGQDASANPAFNGSQATAVGGKGGNSAIVALSATGTVTGRSNISVTGGNGGQGGIASVYGGAGGQANVSYPDGGSAGNMSATGGNGGLARTVDLTGSPNGRSGDGGSLQAFGGHGGAGAPQCNPARPGGSGGRGGSLSGRPGFAGAGTARGLNGVLDLNTVGNGGNGDKGTPVGAAGAGGSFLVEPGFVRTDLGTSFISGNPGSSCVQSVTRNVVLRFSAVPSSGGYVSTGTYLVPIDDAVTGQQVGTIPLVTVGGNFSHYYGSNPPRIGTDNNGGWRFDIDGLVAPGLTNPRASTITLTFMNTTGVSASNPIILRQNSSAGATLQNTSVTSNNANPTLTMDPLTASVLMMMGVNPMQADILMSMGIISNVPLRDR